MPYNVFNYGDNMNSERKTKLINYLYPTVEIAEFMTYDFYPELTFVLDKKVCFSVENEKESVRKINFEKAKRIVSEYIDKNLKYKRRLVELYRRKVDDSFIEEMLWGYVLFITYNINRGTGADVFWDKRSVCYKELSILDVE